MGQGRVSREKDHITLQSPVWCEVLQEYLSPEWGGLATDTLGIREERDRRKRLLFSPIVL